MTTPSLVPSRFVHPAVHSRLYSKRVAVPSAAPLDIADPDDTRPAAADWEHTPKRTMPLLHRIAVHEASHAAVRLYLGLGTITRITIDAPHGGYVESRIDEFHEQTEEILTAHLSIMLAGRAGEEVITGIVGANGDGETEGGDHELATKLAYDMETSMGFGQHMPLLYRRCTDWAQDLATNAKLAATVNRRLERAYEAACKMVSKQIPAIDYLYRQLLHHGTLEGPELEKVLVETSKLIEE